VVLGAFSGPGRRHSASAFSVGLVQILSSYAGHRERVSTSVIEIPPLLAKYAKKAK
jgi:hypothetical protein